jgi:DNA-binding response OmpR family regulator
MPSHRILYVGYHLNLLQSLSRILEDCQVVRCPGGSNAHLLIESNIKYSLFLFDDELPDITGAELAQFTRKLKHRATTPIVILSKDKARGVVAGLFFEKSYNVGSIVETITARLQDSKN